jgi:Domain of unknown function (DUF4357)
MLQEILPFREGTMGEVVQLRDLLNSAEWAEHQRSIVLTMEVKGVKARANFEDGRIRVLKDSTAAKAAVDTIKPIHRQRRNDVVRDGVLRDDAHCYTFTQDYVFEDAGPAACVVAGASRNGLNDWTMPDGRKLGECIHKFVL